MVIYVALGILVLVLLLWFAFGVAPRSYRRTLFRQFWGPAAFGTQTVLCWGSLTDSRLTQSDPPTYRYVKRYRDGRALQLLGPTGNVAGSAEVRAVSYLINCLRTHRTRPVTVIDDTGALGNLNRTIIALGGPLSNEITDFILKEPNNRFIEFGQEGNVTFIRDKKSDRRFESSHGGVRKEYGAIIRLPSLRFPGHSFFACAGLGEWGTSGAAWFLARQWRNLQGEFSGAFAVVVEVEIGSDESARRVFPNGNRRKVKRKSKSRKAYQPAGPGEQQSS
ncbi:MAG: hypothetical protein ACOC58_04305 [Chloroflexota bacterium]